jgi:hypothetical protein
MDDPNPFEGQRPDRCMTLIANLNQIFSVGLVGLLPTADYNGALNIRARAFVNALTVSERSLDRGAYYRDKLELQRASV